MEEKIIQGLIWYSVFLFSVTCHEAAHAFAAWRLGDATAFLGGQVSLNPLPHIQREPVGMVLVPLLFLFTSGYPLGWASTPYSVDWSWRFPKRASLMALAGPLANLLICLAAGFALRYTEPLGLNFAAQKILQVLFYLNIILFVFNLFPFPPMDGAGILGLFLPEDKARQFQTWSAQRSVAAIGMLSAFFLMPPILGRALTFASSLFFGQ